MFIASALIKPQVARLLRALSPPRGHSRDQGSIYPQLPPHMNIICPSPPDSSYPPSFGCHNVKRTRQQGSRTARLSTGRRAAAALLQLQASPVQGFFLESVRTRRARSIRVSHSSRAPSLQHLNLHSSPPQISPIILAIEPLHELLQAAVTADYRWLISAARVP
ncbi:hypothetical protein J3459_018121 [Metarhizium acridum]|nr:hypothetical protein J3459_018121 [Metarhizium acridum]